MTDLGDDFDATHFRFFYVSEIIPAVNRRFLHVENRYSAITPPLIIAPTLIFVLCSFLSTLILLSDRISISGTFFLFIVLALFCITGVVMIVDRQVSPKVVNELVRRKLAEAFGWGYESRDAALGELDHMREELRIRPGQLRDATGAWKISGDDAPLFVIDAKFEMGSTTDNVDEFPLRIDNTFGTFVGFVAISDWPTPPGFKWSVTGGAVIDEPNWAHVTERLSHPDLVGLDDCAVYGHFLIHASDVARARLTPTPRQLQAIKSFEEKIIEMLQPEHCKVSIHVGCGELLIAVNLGAYLIAYDIDYADAAEAVPQLLARRRLIAHMTGSLLPALRLMEEQEPIAVRATHDA